MWLVPVLGWIVIGNGFQPWLNKRIANTGKEWDGQGFAGTAFLMLINFSICCLYTLMLSMALGETLWDSKRLPIIAVGFFNALANFVYWKGMAISLSKVSIFLVFDDLIAMGLAYWILQEGKFMTSGLSVVITLCLVSVLFLSAYKKRRAEIKQEACLVDGVETKQLAKHVWKQEITFLTYVLIFSITWGVAMFAMNYFPKQGLSQLTFLSSWYIGSVCGGSLLLLLSRRPLPSFRSIGKSNWRLLALLSVCMPVTNGFGIWAFKLAPQVVIQPIFLVSAAVVPVLIGFYLFREIKELDWLEKMLFAMSLLGVIIIAIAK